MFRLNTLKKTQAILNQLQPKSRLRSQNSVRIVYQKLTDLGAFGYIDRGFINGYQAIGADVVVWDSRLNKPDLATILSVFRPTHFVGYLQEGGSERAPSAWLSQPFFALLREHKEQNGLFVAVRSNPSNIRDLFREVPFDFNQYPEAGVASFYLQPERPSNIERMVFSTGFVDLIRSPIAHHVYQTAFKNYLDLGLPILEEPHAADLVAYGAPEDDTTTKPTKNILFVGGCWPFKWHNMAPYIENLRREFGAQFSLYGKGWPASLSQGILPENKYHQTVANHRIHIALHEPSQVLDFPFAGNERVFKLLAMNCFVISDPNPLLKYHLTDGKEIVISESAPDMVSKINYFLGCPEEMQAIKQRGRQRVLKEHSYAFRAQRLLALSMRNSFDPISKYK